MPRRGTYDCLGRVYYLCHFSASAVCDRTVVHLLFSQICSLLIFTRILPGAAEFQNNEFRAPAHPFMPARSRFRESSKRALAVMIIGQIVNAAEPVRSVVVLLLLFYRHKASHLASGVFFLSPSV